MQGRSGHRTTRLGRGTALRRLCCWLAVLPFLLFSLIQPGTMFVRDAQGSVAVVLCSGEGPVQMAVAADGSLVPADDLDALTGALRKWLDDDDARQAAGRAARAHVETRHAIEGEAAALVAIYRDLLARP